MIALTAASALLLAAGNVSQADTVAGGPQISDEMLAPVSAGEAAASAAALAATTPADVAAAYSANLATDAVADRPANDAVADRPAKLTTLVASIDKADTAGASARDLKCLATAIYFEARGEPVEGQLAVAQTIINRVESGRYAGTVCGVVYQPHQFSFDHTRAPRAGSDWQTAQAIARIAVGAMWHAIVPKSISYHATRVSPNWTDKTRVATIGNHIFYR